MNDIEEGAISDEGPNVISERPKRGGLRNVKMSHRTVSDDQPVQDVVIFRSRTAEASRFNIDIGEESFTSHPCNPPGHLEWHIPTQFADRVRRHHMVKSSRVSEV